VKRGWLGAGALVVGIASLLGVLAYVLDHARASVRVVHGLGEAAEPAREEALAVPEELGDERELARVAKAASRPRPAALEVFVVDEEGKRVPFVEVLAYRGGELLRAMETRTSSGAMIPFDGPATLRVEWNTNEVERLDIPDGHGRYEIVVAHAARVAGIVRVDGEPREGLDVALVTGGDDWLSGWIEYGLASAGWLRRSSTWSERTGADGGFSLGWLAPRWSGGLRLDEGYRFVGGGSRLDLPRPAEGLVLDVVALRPEVRIRGRAMLGGGPVSSATWNAGVLGWGKCDGLGRFSFHARADALAGESLTLSAPEQGERTLALDAPGFSGELGDVELEPTHDLAFLVRSEAGAPIAGAWAVSRGTETDRFDRLSRSRGTDAAGRGVMPGLLPGEDALHVGAKGYALTEVAAPTPLTEPLEIVLPRAPAFEVLLRDPSGRVPPGLHVRLESRVPPFAWKNGLDPQGPELLPPWWGYQAVPSAAGFEAEFAADEGGHAWLEPLRAGKAFDVLAVDALGTVLASMRGQSLAPGEWRRLELRVAAAARTVLVLVRDTLGHPLDAARVTLEAEGSPTHPLALTTDRAGMVRTEPVYAERARLSVSSRGFETRTLEHLSIPPEGATLEIRLAHEWFAW